MTRAEQPASPEQESLAAGDRLTEDSILTRELSEFLQSGLSIIIAAVGRDGRPVAGVALACVIDPDGTTRIIMRRAANPRLLEAVADGSSFATTLSRPITHRSIQLKSAGAREVPLRPGEEAAVARQSAVFRDELIAIDHDVPFANAYTAYRPMDLTVLEFRPEEAFVQTPGPGAGARLAGAPR